MRHYIGCWKDHPDCAEALVTTLQNALHEKSQRILELEEKLRLVSVSITDEDDESDKDNSRDNRG